MAPALDPRPPRRVQPLGLVAGADQWPNDRMRTGRALLLATTMLCCVAASAKEAGPDQVGSQDSSRPKPVTTTIIKRCPDGYELVIRSGGRRGCAKDIVPPND